MPYSTFTNLGLGKLAPAKLIIELADKTVKRPKGIADNVLVGIDRFAFPIDFIILDMPEDIKILLILERPFLSTARAKIDRRELDLEARLIGEALILNRSQDPGFGDFLELNDLNEPLELRNHKMEDLDPEIEDGEIIDEPKVDIVKIKCDDEIIERIDEYPKIMDAYRDKDMGDVIFGKPFCRVACVEARRFDGFITIHVDNDSVTYQMARSHPRSKHLSNKQRNKIRPLLQVSTRDILEGNLHSYQKLKVFFKGVLNLGPEYIKHGKMVEWLTCGHVSIHEMD
ncbi:gag-pol polyprotein [Tanacetum coccineum]